MLTGLWVGQLGFNSWQAWRYFSLCHFIRTGCEAYLASYPLGTRGSFLGGKVAAVWTWPLTSI